MRRVGPVYVCRRYIHNYAKALVDPLPRNALVFVNYDLQWTAIRYLQRCEGFRYARCGYIDNADGGFSLRDLVRVNIDKFPGGIYLGGQLNFPDPSFHDHFITVPYGLLDKVRRIVVEMP
ncbi:hypothetical protein DYB32_005516 [Aphanomyces invadans]|uniref:Uncharacterized protein n=1 Tax=Aphanomyces invadans TaxID=157072 RepID=A0A3R6VKV2_9STRA|nr:hypothetical protein DYB32_005516 [Aphanomyces invadans]